MSPIFAMPHRIVTPRVVETVIFTDVLAWRDIKAGVCTDAYANGHNC